MYSSEYKKRVDSVISEEVNSIFIVSHNAVIQEMSSPGQISFHFAIMEVESWWIGMHSLLEKIDKDLTSEFIKSKLGFSLTEIDPENYFFHPASVLKDILQLVGLLYSKKRSHVEFITSLITIDDVSDLIDTGKCSSFKLLYKSIKNGIET